MKPLLAAWVGAVVMVSAVCAQAAPAQAAQASSSWLDDFQRYCGQDQLEVDYGYGAEPVAVDGKPGRISFREVLRRLPAPEGWRRLKQEVAEREKALSAEKTIERQRLEAARWLLTYLAEGKGAALAVLPAVAERNEDEAFDELRYELGRLRWSLESTRADTGTVRTPAELLKQFEDALEGFSEVSEEQVKEVVGEGKLAVLQRIVAAQKEVQQRVNALYTAAQKSGDTESVGKEVQTLSSEFIAKHTEDYQQLLPLLQNEMVARYWSRQLEGDESRRDYGPMQLQVPDLAGQTSDEHAGILLRRAMRLPVTLTVDDTHAETRSLARRVALEEIAVLRAPQWGLTMSEQDGELFEALRRRFPDAKSEYSGYREAYAWRLVALIRQGKIQEAMSLADETADPAKSSLPYGALETLTPEQESFFVDFLRERVRRNPSDNEWDALVQLSAKTGRADELTALVDTLAADAELKGLGRIVVQRMKAESELAQDKIEPAMDRLAALIESPESDGAALAGQMSIAQRLLTLGDLQNGRGIDATIAAGDKILKAAWRSRTETELSLAKDWMTALNKAGRYAEAVRAGEEAMSAIAEADKKKSDGSGDEPRRLSADYSASGVLAEQLCALTELKRVDDAATLLRENAWWQVADVVGLLRTRVHSTQRPLGFYAGRLALAQGERARAQAIFEAQVLADPACDAAYAAWIEVVGMEALPLLEKLAAADRYEERPLIWKAHLLIEARRWDEAEAVLRAAIAIDPSDGEQGRGDRMRVYAFMARVMTGKGDAKQAAFFEDVVKAIRLSERADRWYEAGAYSRAIALYRESLGFFADAYCIQSRLAVRLSKEGKMDEAAVHYQKAFELMPDSFGRVESHCFGCEHVFEGEKTQSVAEEVFTRMLAARPEKPQLHYLMGYLNEERERFTEAAGFYRAAVKLDPLYLNAWKRLSGLDERAGLTAGERDDLLLTLTTLDPGRRHVSPDLERVTDLPRLWRVLDATSRQVGELKPAGALWPMPASAEAIKNSRTAEQYSWRGGSVEEESFARVLSRSDFAQALQSYLVSLARPDR